MANIMGIDVGFGNMGIVVVNNNDIVYYQTISTKPAGKKKKVSVADDDARRTDTLYLGLREVIDEYKPVVAFVESPTGGSQSSRAARTMGMGSSAVWCALSEKQIPYEQISPRTSKKMVAGSSRAQKEEIQEVVLDYFNWPDTIHKEDKNRTEHVCDAAGVILAAVRLKSPLLKEVGVQYE